ncbi:MAG: signal peptidase I [Solobacterium sp.]|nr:signal peptidase I [Solobacterium sp.]
MEETKEIKKDKKEEQKEETLAESVWDLLKTFMVCMILVSLFVNFVARPIRVQGSSMYPTLTSNALGFANVYGKKFGSLKRFDIAIIYLKDKKEYLVKRVIGLPGETVQYSNGTLQVNGKTIEEPFLDTPYRKNWGDGFMEDVSPVTLGEGEYFCLGDNRPSSRDSRYYGAFTDDQIIAKGAFIFYPFSEFGVKSW